MSQQIDDAIPDDVTLSSLWGESENQLEGKPNCIICNQDTHWTREHNKNQLGEKS